MNLNRLQQIRDNKINRDIIVNIKRVDKAYKKAIKDSKREVIKAFKKGEKDLSFKVPTCICISSRYEPFIESIKNWELVSDVSGVGIIRTWITITLHDTIATDTKGVVR